MDRGPSPITPAALRSGGLGPAAGARPFGHVVDPSLGWSHAPNPYRVTVRPVTSGTQTPSTDNPALGVMPQDGPRARLRTSDMQPPGLDAFLSFEVIASLQNRFRDGSAVEAAQRPSTSGVHPRRTPQRVGILRRRGQARTSVRPLPSYYLPARVSGSFIPILAAAIEHRCATANRRARGPDGEPTGRRATHQSRLLGS